LPAGATDLAFPWGEIGLGSQKAKALVLWFSEPANKEFDALSSLQNQLDGAQ
jgi:hypothetical protein